MSEMRDMQTKYDINELLAAIDPARLSYQEGDTATERTMPSKTRGCRWSFGRIGAGAMRHAITLGSAPPNGAAFRAAAFR